MDYNKHLGQDIANYQHSLNHKWHILMMDSGLRKDSGLMMDSKKGFDLRKDSGSLMDSKKGVDLGHSIFYLKELSELLS